MIRRFLGAVQFLTVLPVRGATTTPGHAAMLFPLVGALLGAFTGASMLVFSMFLTRSLSALLALAILLVATGCLHEDGLADVADAVRAGRTREKMMAILKDSRIGTYGAVALVLSIGIRWQAMAELANPVAGLAVALALSRGSLVVLAGIAPSVGSGMGQAFAIACTRNVVTVTAVQALAVVFGAAWFIGIWPALAMLTASLITILLARHYFLRRLGGLNGDCLGATCQAVETINLVILSCHCFI